MTFNNTLKKETQFPCTTNLYLFKDNNRNTRKGCEIYSKLTVKTPEQRQWSRSGVFIVNFEKISHLFRVSIIDFIQVSVCSDILITLQ